jgi:hypothetical protein
MSSTDTFRVDPEYAFVNCLNPDPKFVNWFSNITFSRNASQEENYFIVMNEYALFAYGEKYNNCVGFNVLEDKMVVRYKYVINPKYFFNRATMQWYRYYAYDPRYDEVGKRL